jgi:chemotaxis protein CheZ
MQEAPDIGTARLETARALVEMLEAGKNQEAEQLIAELSLGRESELFQEVGRLTRELHEAINGFLLDARMAELTEIDIPDAKERLSYVITMTQQSADRTLTAVEKSLPLVAEMEGRAKQLAGEWDKFRSRQLNKDEFQELSLALDGFLKESACSAAALHENISEVLMAQDFQDLTGQIIKKVIDLVQDLEQRLVMLVRITGQRMEVKREQQPEKLEGPVVPGVDQGDVVNGQDEVDDLLSSLGF